MSLTLGSVVQPQSAPAVQVHPSDAPGNRAVSGRDSHANVRSSRDFAKARRHSKVVAILKKLLPAGAVFVVLSFATSAIISYNPIAEQLISQVGLEDGKLVMKEPEMAGFDKNERAYKVQAHRAIQDLTKPGTVELEKIDATLPIGTSAFAHVDADAGTYDTKSEKLNLRKNITVKSARGMNIAMEEADIDMKTGEMVSQKPVSVVSDDADISADSVSVHDNGKRIVFKRRVKMTIKRPNKQNPNAKAGNSVLANGN